MFRLIVIVLVLSGCSVQPNDPIEPVNKAMYKVNEGTDYLIFKPITWLYNGFIPPPVKTGLKNVLNNLSTIPSMILDLVILDLTRFKNDSIRFSMNTSIGLGGLMDIAKMNGITQKTS